MQKERQGVIMWNWIQPIIRNHGSWCLLTYESIYFHWTCWWQLKQLCLYCNRETWSASQTPQSPPISANTVESLTVMSVNPSETKGSPYMGHKFLCTLTFRNNHWYLLCSEGEARARSAGFGRTEWIEWSRQEKRGWISDFTSAKHKIRLCSHY